MKEIFRPAKPGFVPLSALFVLGVVAVQQLPALPGLSVLVLLGLVCAALLSLRLHLSAALILGVIWAGAYGTLRLSGPLPPETERQSALVRGTILEIPRTFERGLRFDFAVEEVMSPVGLTVPSRIRLSWYDPKQPPKAGEHWQFLASLRRPHGMSNPGGFDHEQWLFAQGIRAVGYIQESTDNRKLPGQALDRLSPRVWRQSLYDRLSEILGESPVAGLVEALTLGIENDITTGQWEVLRRTGTAHLIAISGSHMALIAGFVFFLVRTASAWLGIKRRPPPSIAAIAALIATFGYSALSGFAIPTQRALIMIAIAMSAIVLRRNPNPPHILALAAFAGVLYDPLAVLAPGFWLSFVAVGLIAFVLAGRTAQSPVWWRVLLKINWATAVGLSAFLLLFFRQISLVSPLANTLAVPVLGTLLVPQCLSGALLLPLVPMAGTWLLDVAEWLLRHFWPVLEWLSALPLAQWTHAEPPFWTIPLAFLGTLLILAPRGIPARWLGGVLLLPALTYQPARPEQGTFRLALLDVGQGLSAVVETRQRLLVFDTGARLSERFDMGEAVIEPYLRQRGITAIDALVISHGDNDHIGGAWSLLHRFTVARTLTSVPEQLPGFRPEACHAGQGWDWDGVRFEMLGPVENLEKENDRSCVLKVTGSGGSALLPGDIEHTAESLLVERHGGKLASEVLVVPHHGSKTSSSVEFLRAVHPAYSLVSAGFLNRFGFPHPAVVQRCGRFGIQVLTTADSGAITVFFGRTRGELRIERHRQSHGHYWSDGPS